MTAGCQTGRLISRTKGARFFEGIPKLVNNDEGEGKEKLAIMEEANQVKGDSYFTSV
jgi:hypothetical protein